MNLKQKDAQFSLGSTIAKMLHWSFLDPAIFQVTQEEKLAKTRIVKDKIK